MSNWNPYEKTDYACYNCGQREVIVEKGEGDYYQGQCALLPYQKALPEELEKIKQHFKDEEELCSCQIEAGMDVETVVNNCEGLSVSTIGSQLFTI